MSKAIIGNRKTQNVVSNIFKVIIVLCVIGFIASIVYTKATIVERQQELSELQTKADKIQSENDEYKRLLDNEDVNAYMEMLAIENMSYAYPNEIRFFDTSRN